MAANDKLIIDKLTRAIQNKLPKLFVEEVNAQDKLDLIKIQLGRSAVYDQKFKSLANLFERQFKKPLTHDRPSMLDFAKWLTNTHIQTLSPKTWTLYKSSLKAIVHDKEFHELISISAVNKKADVVKRSSSKRVKELSEELFSKIVARIAKSDSKYADVTNRLLFVVRRFGIRPAEILNSSLITYGGFRFLKVRSLKKENHFVHNQAVDNPYPYRYIPAVHLSDEDLRYVEATLHSFAQVGSKEAFATLYESMRFVFMRACEKLRINTDDESYSIYSARQQFSSDLKATLLDNHTRVLIMSHNKEETLRHYYGKKLNGKPLFEPNAKLESTLLECFERQV